MVQKLCLWAQDGGENLGSRLRIAVDKEKFQSSIYSVVLDSKTQGFVVIT